MSKFSDFSYSPYTNSTNSQFNPNLYNKTGAVTGCTGIKKILGGSRSPPNYYYGFKQVDQNTASALRGSYPPMVTRSHSQCAGKRRRTRRKRKAGTLRKKFYKAVIKPTYKATDKMGITHHYAPQPKYTGKGGKFGLRKKHRSVTYTKAPKTHTSQGSVPRTMVRYGGKKRKSRKTRKTKK